MLEGRKRKREAEVQREVEDKRAHRMLRRNSRAWKMENGDGATENTADAGGARKRKAEREGAVGDACAAGDAKMKTKKARKPRSAKGKARKAERNAKRFGVRGKA